MSLRNFGRSIFALGIVLITLGAFFFCRGRSFIVTDNEIVDDLHLTTSDNGDYGVKIKKLFNIDVVTSGFEGYIINDHPVIMLDGDANGYLQDLYLNLSLYPTNFFRELGNKIPLTIYLVKSIDNTNITGATDVSDINNAIMTIAVDFNIGDTLHHEVYHYTEDFMILNGVDFSDWNKIYNDNYKYGSTNMDLVFGFTSDCGSALFTSDYGQTDEYEDRASVFESLMYDNNSIACYNDRNSILYKKASRIAKEMDEYLGSVTDKKEYWERFIYE